MLHGSMGWKTVQTNQMTFCLAICLIFLCATVAFAEKISMDYTFEQPQIITTVINGETYDQIIMPGAPNSGKIGHPALPATGARILIPYGSEISGIEIVQGEEISIGSGYYIEPVTRPYPLSVDPATITPTLPDEAIYSLDQAIPEMRYKNIGLQNFRGYQILTLRLNPVRYIPLSGTLSYFPKLTVVVNTMDTQKSAPLYRGLPQDEAELSKRIDNTDQIYSYNAAPKSGSKSFDMLIITTPELVSFYQTLEDYHDTTGITTEIHTTADIGSTDPTDVRNYIRDRYLYDGINYVLIGGDDDLIPAVDLYIETDPGPDNYVDSTMPGDIYFACLDGTYNYDGDELWGESTDGEGGGDVDLFAEVYLGRASASNAPEAYTFVAKTLVYVNESREYLDDILLIGENLAFGGYGEYGGYSLNKMIDFSNDDGQETFGFPSKSFGLETLYDLNWPVTNAWPTSEVINRINDGQHIINHYGHCNVSWALKMTSNTAYSQFTNDELFFLYSQGCNAGWFDDNECWAEFVTTKTESGAFAVIMNSRYGFGAFGTDGPSQRYNREFWDAVFNPGENMPELGRANQDSKEDNVYRIDETCMRWCTYQLNVFGDPTLPIKTRDGIAFNYLTEIPKFVENGRSTAIDAAIWPMGSDTTSVTGGSVYYSVNDASYETVGLTNGGADLYTGALPAIECGDKLEFYFSADLSIGETYLDPDPLEPFTMYAMGSLDTLFEDDFETDKGWTISGGLWARGIPTGQGGTGQQYPTPDPTSGCNGPNVYGYNLSGDYEPYMDEMHLTSPPINCSGQDNIHLNFMRWLSVGIPLLDHAYIRVSNNGTDWTTVWENSCCLADNFWNEMEYDISEVADNQPTVYIRITMGTSADAGYCGWNIDDLTVLSYNCMLHTCGDVDNNDLVNILDVTYLISYLYKEGSPPESMWASDADGNGVVNILDITYLISFLYKGGSEPICQ